jgi:beta-glucosidase
MTLKYAQLILCVCFSCVMINPAQAKPSINESKKIDALIAKMTIEEKVGQMTNLTLATIANKIDEPVILDMEKLRDAIVKHNIGSFQNTINHAYTLEEWHYITNTIQQVALQETRLKIPNLYAIDAVHGANNTLGSTLFPHNLGLAATRNPALVKLSAEITAKEVRASGIRLDYSPVLDLGRQPLWSRFPETFGEDVFIAKTLGVAAINGYEGKSLRDVASVASSMKHFIGYSAPADGKDRTPAYIPEIMLREYYLPPFKAAIAAGAHTLMVNSGEVNGTPLHASKYFLTDILRKELGFNGVITSDWEDIKKLHERHKVAASNKEAAFLAVNAGIDMVIVPSDFSFYEDLIALVKEHKITEKRLNESVKRILQLKYDLGYFDHPYLEPEAVKNFAQPEYKKAALEAARESIILLKNTDNTLPLSRNKKYLVVGPGSDSLTWLHGCWSYTWQGTEDKYFAKDTLTIAKAIKAKVDAGNVIQLPGTDFDSKDINIAEAVTAAKNVDVIIVALGENAYAETVGNINDLELPEMQQQLINELALTGKTIVLVLSAGRPRIIRKIEPKVKGFLLANWPGSQGAAAIADVLFGDYNPDGILPYTYPRFSGELLTYDHKWLSEAIEEVLPVYKYSYVFNPQYPFGHGLSYTTFEYSDLTFSANKFAGNENIQISITLKNTGKVAGKHTVELYSRDLYAAITPSVKRLRKFQKIWLAPGTSQTLTFELSKSDLEFVNAELKPVTEDGDFDIIIGNLKKALAYVNK